MSMDRETIHMALATFLSDNPDKQIKDMAFRYLKKEISPKRKTIYKSILKDPNPSKTVLEVYEERFNA